MSTFVLDKMQFISNICKFVVANLLTYTICFLYICIKYFYFSLRFFHQKKKRKTASLRCFFL